MAEYIRDIKVTLVVDTNKRTIRLERDLDSLADVVEVAENMQEEAVEAVS